MRNEKMRKFAVVFFVFPVALAQSQQWSCHSSPFHFSNVPVSRSCRLLEFTLTGPLKSAARHTFNWYKKVTGQT